MNDWERQHRQAQKYKEAYPPGTRLMLLSMNDPYRPVESGTRGTVRHVEIWGRSIWIGIMEDLLALSLVRMNSAD